ncbi:unnamed protein product [Phytomonas sp. Hart1]|nr:unnamed protein product [Phytomonas sp. Hart1]|eukprot:CCW70793.1 unnamed protein product [Phytomonas sp. isolate Hart1]
MEESDDPVVLLRQMQKSYNEKEAQSDGQVPPASPRRYGKCIIEMDLNSSAMETSTHQVLKTVENDPKETPESGADSSSDHTTFGSGPHQNNEEGSEKKTAATRNLFIERLKQMEAKRHLPSFPTYDAATEARRQKIQQKVREERKRMLVFRNVGMELDKPILSRDVFLIFKYFYYGAEFAIDNELERMLRYFNENALNELKIIEDSKLMRGPSTLSRPQKKGLTPLSSVFSKPNNCVSEENAAWAFDPKSAQPHVINYAKIDNGPGAYPAKASNAELLPSQPIFPRVLCANMNQFCQNFDAEVCQVLLNTLRPSLSQSLFSGFFPITDAATTARDVPKSFSEKDSSLFTALSAKSFRRPALVIYSQLGQKFGSIADLMWRRLAYHTICPALLAYIPKIEEPNTNTAKGSPEWKSSPPHSTTTTHRRMSIDVVSLRSMDLYTYKWVHSLYVRSFARSLSLNKQTNERTKETKGLDTKRDHHKEATIINNALLASTTFVGSKILEPFNSSLGLRNYLCPYAMLVDHEGVVRWIGGGCPDAYEATHFPGLLKQLENEYFKKNSFS